MKKANGHNSATRSFHWKSGKVKKGLADQHQNPHASYALGVFLTVWQQNNKTTMLIKKNMAIILAPTSQLFEAYHKSSVESIKIYVSGVGTFGSGGKIWGGRKESLIPRDMFLKPA